MYPNLKLQLWKCGLRQNHAAKLLGIDATTMSRIVNGIREPGPELRNSMAILLRSDVVWLFERQVEEKIQIGDAAAG